MKLPNKPVEFRRDSQEDLTDDMDHFALLSINGTTTARTGSEEKIAVLRRKHEAHRDALFRCGYRQCILQVPTDWHLSLCCSPQDRVHDALNDATRVLHHVDFCLVSSLDIAQLVLSIKSEQPGFVLFDKAHYRHRRKLRRAHAGAQREIRDSTISRRKVCRALEIKCRIDQIGFRLTNLRSGLGFRGVGGEKFALEICEIALRLLKVSSFPGASRGQSGELLDAFFRQFDPRGYRSFFVRAICESILRSLQGRLGGSFRRLERHRVDLEKPLAFLDRPVWFNRNLGYLTRHTRHYWDHIILRPYVGRRRGADVHEQNQNRQRDD